MHSSNLTSGSIIQPQTRTRNPKRWTHPAHQPQRTLQHSNQPIITLTTTINPELNPRLNLQTHRITLLRHLNLELPTMRIPQSLLDDMVITPTPLRPTRNPTIPLLPRPPLLNLSTHSIDEDLRYPLRRAGVIPRQTTRRRNQQSREDHLAIPPDIDPVVGIPAMRRHTLELGKDIPGVQGWGGGITTPSLRPPNLRDLIIKGDARRPDIPISTGTSKRSPTHKPIPRLPAPAGALVAFKRSPTEVSCPGHRHVGLAAVGQAPDFEGPSVVGEGGGYGVGLRAGCPGDVVVEAVVLGGVVDGGGGVLAAAAVAAGVVVCVVVEAVFGFEGWAGEGVVA